MLGKKWIGINDNARYKWVRTKTIWFWMRQLLFSTVLLATPLCLYGNAFRQSNPTAAFSATTVCQGSATIFTNNSSSLSGVIIASIWDFGDGTGSTVFDPQHIYSSSGTFPVTLTVVNSQGDVDDVTVLVTVNPAAAVNFSFTSATQCPDVQFGFNNLTAIVSGSVSAYAWDFGDGNLSSAINPAHAFTESGSFQVTLSATSDLGCNSSLSKHIEIYPEALVAFEAEDQCFGEPVHFTNTTQVASGIVNFQWNFDDGNLSSAESPDHLFAAPASFDVRLTATTDRGCVTYIEHGVTIHPAPVAVFSVADHCLGTSQPVLNTSSIASGNFSSSWQFGDGTVSTLGQPSLQYTESGNFLVSLELASDQGCVAASSQYVQVFERPVIDFTVADQCLNTAIKVVNNTTIGEGPILYAWDFGDGALSTETNPAHNYTAAGTYNVALEATSQHGCTVQSQQSVTIFPLPVAAFDVNNHCLATAAPLTNSSSIAQGTIDYTWTFSDGFVSSADEPSHQFSNPGNFTVSLELVSDHGCTASLAKPVYVNPAPVVDFSFANNCQGLISTFINNTSISEGSLSYAWTFGDGGLATETNPQHLYQTNGLYAVQLSATTTAGCSRALTKNIEIYATPIASFSMADVCQDVVVTISNTSTIAQGNVTYSWNFGDNMQSSAISPQHQYSSPGDYLISLTASSTNNCVSSFQRVVTVHPLPVVDFSVNNVCAGTGTQLFNTSFIGKGPLSYFWDFGDGQLSNLSSPVKSYAADGSYDISLTATSAQGCASNAIRTITVFPKPVASFAVSDHCFGTEMTVVNQTTVSSGAVSFSWDFGDGNVSSAENPVVEYARTGVFLIKLEASNAAQCKSFFQKYVNVNPMPIVDFAATTVCSGDATIFTNRSTVAQGNMTFLWEFGDAATDNSFAPSHVYSSYQNYSVSLTATSSIGSCIASVSKNIEVLQRPIAQFSVEDNCLDSLIRFTNATQYVGNDITHYWTFGNGVTSTDENPSIMFSRSQTYAVTLRATSSNGCSTSFSDNLDVYPKPKANFFTTNVCDGVNAEFTDFSTITTGTLSYHWSFGDNTNSTAPSPTHLYGQDGSYDVRLDVTSEHGCADRMEKAITIYPLPLTIFSAGAVCEGFATSFTNNSNVSYGAITSSVWDFGDQSNSIVKNPVKEYISQGTYEVVLTSVTDKGCSTSASDVVEVYELPVADFSVGDVCLGTTAVFLNHSTISSGSLEYQWLFGDGQMSIATSPFYQYQQSGVFSPTLIVTTDKGCKDSVSYPLAIFPAPLVDAGPDQTVSQGYSVQLQVFGGELYQWQPITGLDNSSIANPVATPLETTHYIVTARDRYGCSNSDTVAVFVNKEFKLVASNVLTPDANGKNDTWVIENVQTFGDVHVRVYDRWGSLVFEKEAYQNDWRGEKGNDLLPDGTYYYYITFSTSDREYRGAITIIRNSKP